MVGRIIAIILLFTTSVALGQASIPRTSTQIAANPLLGVTTSNLTIANPGLTTSILPGEVAGLPQFGSGAGLNLSPYFYGNYYQNSLPFQGQFGNGFFINRGIDCSGPHILIHPNPCSGQAPMYTPPSYFQSGQYLYNSPFYQYNPSFNGNFYQGSPFFQGRYLGNPMFGFLGQQPARFTHGIADPSRYTSATDAFGNLYYSSVPAATVNESVPISTVGDNGVGITILN